jgi:ABC-2 type transport system ATP-binding protein
MIDIETQPVRPISAGAWKSVDLPAKINEVASRMNRPSKAIAERPGDPVLRIDQLTKVYETVKAVDRLSFDIPSGKIIGLLGPNGAGKSTTINMILGILEPTEGTVEVFGLNMASHRSAICARTNFAAVYAHVPLNLTVRQSLVIFGLLYGAKPVKARVAELLKEYELEQFADHKAGLLSSGELSRLSLAKALINRPRLLLLDEPTASLDPSVAQLIRERIKNYVAESGAAVLWTSHNMKEISEVCDEVMFLSHGKILLKGDPAKLPAEHGKFDLDELFIAVAREPLSLKE